VGSNTAKRFPQPHRPIGAVFASSPGPDGPFMRSPPKARISTQSAPGGFAWRAWISSPALEIPRTPRRADQQPGHQRWWGKGPRRPAVKSRPQELQSSSAAGNKVVLADAGQGLQPAPESRGTGGFQDLCNCFSFGTIAAV